MTLLYGEDEVNEVIQQKMARLQSRIDTADFNHGTIK